MQSSKRLNGLNLDNASVNRLAAAIVKQACRYYYDSCVFNHDKFTYHETKNGITQRRPWKKKGRPVYTFIDYIEMIIQYNIQRCKMLEDCETFFRSQYFSQMCNIDPDVLMRTIKQKRLKGEPLFYPEYGDESGDISNV